MPNHSPVLRQQIQTKYLRACDSNAMQLLQPISELHNISLQKKKKKDLD